jgi:serine/threonine-protein kinase
MTRSSALLRDGTILNDRYRIIKSIGRGGFGHAYLAEDTQRYREKCVLKEFAPQVENNRDLHKAEELFEREAGILYRLKHDQIPKFEALLRTRIDGKESLFLVQEYVEGDSYWDLLKRGGKFSEEEVTRILWELLPVLEYIHGENLIHRDISPDNLIRRDRDGKPVLIDFGCVKLAANAVSKTTGQYLTQIGKKGYAPEEQMRSGQAFPNSDLYALAVTILVLLTEKQPDALYNSYKGQWLWQEEIKVSSYLGKILDKMLAYHPRDRYSTAAQVQQALEKGNLSLVSSLISRIRTLVVAPGNPEADKKDHPVSQAISQVNSNISRLKTLSVSVSRRLTQPITSSQKNLSQWQRLTLIATAAILLPGILTFNFIRGWLTNTDLAGFPSSSSTLLSSQEQNQQKKIYQRIQDLNINPSDFYNQVDRVFYSQYPKLKGITLTDKVEHHKYREIWYKIADQLLDEKSQD